MGIWDAPGGPAFPAALEDGPLARLLQSLMVRAAAGENVPYIEPPGPGYMPPQRPALPLPSAADIAAMGGAHVAQRSRGADDPQAALYGMTGIPDQLIDIIRKRLAGLGGGGAAIPRMGER